MSGLILIDRAMLDHHIVGIKNPLRFSAWCWMLSKTRYKEGKFFHHGHEIDLKIGQFACARKHMSDETGMTEKQVRVFLTALERSNMVTKAVHEKGQGISIISITKYQEYQDFSKYREMKGPSKGPAKGQGRAKVGPDSVTPEETPEETPVLSKVHFDLFWNLWPNKSSKQTAVKAWDKLSAEDHHAVIALPNAGYDGWQQSAPNANPILPASFLNQRRWEDAPLLKGINNGNGTNNHTSNRAAEKAEKLRRIVTTAARGTSTQDWATD